MHAEQRRQRREAIEADARQLALAGDFARSAKVLIEGLGPGLLGYLHAMGASQAEAEDTFGTVCERLWRTLPEFEWTGSICTYLYVIARNHHFDHLRKHGARPTVALSQLPELEAAVRSSTATYLRSTAKDRLSRIRDQLDNEDRALLVLRYERSMGWIDIARIMSGGAMDESSCKRESSRLRKRFERIKQRLRTAWNAADDDTGDP